MIDNRSEPMEDPVERRKRLIRTVIGMCESSAVASTNQIINRIDLKIAAAIHIINNLNNAGIDVPKQVVDYYDKLTRDRDEWLEVAQDVAKIISDAAAKLTGK